MPEMELDEKEKLNALPWAHIYPQYCYHDPAILEGTREALKSIADAINAVLGSGHDGEARLFAGDGEGYALEIKIRNYEYLSDKTKPYLAHWACGIGAQEVESYERDRERDRAAGLVSVPVIGRANTENGGEG